MNEQIPSPNSETSYSSPKWGSTTKLVVGLAFVALLAALFVQFRQIIGPILLAFVLAFLLQPVAARISTMTKLSWRGGVNLVYVVFVLVLVGIFTIAGLAIVQQIAGVVDFVTDFMNGLPEWFAEISIQKYSFGPFQIDMTQFDLPALAEQLLGVVQPLLGKAGSLVSALATGAAGTVGWGFFVVLISYFLLSESSRVPEDLLQIELPGYNADRRRLARELGKIWNSFLRGQLIISLLVVIAYYILLTILGLRLTLAIALMAGAACFIPWVGPFITWTVTAIVAFLQIDNYFGLTPLQYTILVLVACQVLNQIFDNLITPRLLGQTLGVHPAGVLIAAIVVTNLIGLVGLVLAAPMLATLNLVGRYFLRKMFDMDPWPEPEKPAEPLELPLARWARRLRAWARMVRR